MMHRAWALGVRLLGEVFLSVQNAFLGKDEALQFQSLL